MFLPATPKKEQGAFPCREECSEVVEPERAALAWLGGSLAQVCLGFHLPRQQIFTPDVAPCLCWAAGDNLTRLARWENELQLEEGPGTMTSPGRSGLPTWECLAVVAVSRVWAGCAVETRGILVVSAAARKPGCFRLCLGWPSWQADILRSWTCCCLAHGEQGKQRVEGWREG